VTSLCSTISHAQGRRRQPGDRRSQRGDPLPTAQEHYLNGIKQLFAKLKALLRNTAARTKDALWQANRPPPRHRAAGPMCQLAIPLQIYFHLT
jgi:hypothetical protein